IMMPGMDGYQVAVKLKEDDETKDIPIIFITANTDSESISKAFQTGGIDYITKPFNPDELLARVNAQVKMKQYQNELKHKNKLLESKKLLLLEEVNEKTKNVEDISSALIGALESANILNDTDTGNHIKRVSEYAGFLAEKISDNTNFIKKIKLYTSLHDVGKVGIPDELLKKPGVFSHEEMEQMKQHVVFGAKMLTAPGVPLMAANIAKYHHEKWDGSGYIEGLSGTNIPLEARIVALADVYDALGTKRVYKDAFSENKIDAIISKEIGKHFDPELVEIYFKNKDKFLEIKAGL
ncbi:MAG: HD domain-containing protein, partial [Spirochaetales bacterium]|nr:HD domain-containing protein [Spirochaetales bacterium]